VAVSRPRIGVTTCTHGGEEPVEAVTRTYVDAVLRAGGMPTVLPVLPPDLALDALTDIDGLLLTGGADVEPARYGGDPHPEVYGVHPDRDEWELALARSAAVPTLGVCRGAQLLNVAAGGTLVAHLPDITELSHREPDRSGDLVHEVMITPGSRLHAVVGALEIGVNTLHHQAVGTLGAGLVATAVAPDGTIEAIEAGDGRPVLGVQWHPEWLPGEAPHDAVFGWLVAAASARREGSLLVR